MKNYHQLTIDQRYQIKAWKSVGLTISDIAKKIGYHKSTVSRELTRNTGLRGYRPKQANEMAISRSTDNQNALKFTIDDWSLVKDLLKKSLSPNQIAKRMKLEESLSISHESIYNPPLMTDLGLIAESGILSWLYFNSGLSYGSNVTEKSVDLISDFNFKV